MNTPRRNFLKRSALAGTGLIIAPWVLNSCATGGGTQGGAEADATAKKASEMFFKISLAEWSLHKSIFAGKLDNLAFPRIAKEEFGLDGVEYVNQFFKDKAEDAAYLAELNKITSDLGVTNVLIMIDGEGQLGSADEAERIKAVENHYKWVTAAKTLGCHSIRVNAAGKGTAEEVAAAAIDGLGRLSSFAAQEGMNIIVENHGSHSSNGTWLSNVISSVGMENCGTLPDFGNFCIRRGEDAEGNRICEDEYDRYKGTKELMAFAKGVSAKTHDFNEAGAEVHTDYTQMLQIVKDAGYRGYVGIEYEGSELGEYEGIQKTIDLLKKVGMELS